MQDNSFSSLDAADIGRDWVQWHPVGRSEALRACMNRPVAVVHRLSGRDVASVLTPNSRFYRSDGAFLYDGLRYFVYTGVGRGKLKALRIGGPTEQEELEPMEALDEAGEAVNLSSPVKKEKKKKPIEFELLDGDGKPMPDLAFEVILPDGTAQKGKTDAEGWIRFPDNIHDGEVQLKVFPKGDHHPSDATRGSGSPSLDEHDPELGLIMDLGLDAIPHLKIPVEILLTTAKGVPMPNTAFTAEFPDGKVESGHSDPMGMIRFPDNTQMGEMVLKLSGLEGHA